MKRAWFVKFGWLKQPITPEGWLILIVILGFLFTVFVAVDRNSHSASDTLYGIFPYFVSSFLMYDWIASRSSKD